MKNADIEARIALAEIISATVYCAPQRESQLSDAAFNLADVFIEHLRRCKLEIKHAT